MSLPIPGLSNPLPPAPLASAASSCFGRWADGSISLHSRADSTESDRARAPTAISVARRASTGSRVSRAASRYARAASAGSPRCSATSPRSSRYMSSAVSALSPAVGRPFAAGGASGTCPWAPARSGRAGRGAAPSRRRVQCDEFEPTLPSRVCAVAPVGRPRSRKSPRKADQSRVYSAPQQTRSPACPIRPFRPSDARTARSRDDATRHRSARGRASRDGPKDLRPAPPLAGSRRPSRGRSPVARSTGSSGEASTCSSASAVTRCCSTSA